MESDRAINGKSLVKLMIELEVRDDKDRLVEERKFEGHSFVRGMLSFLRSAFRTTFNVHLGDEPVTDVANAAQTIYGHHHIWGHTNVGHYLGLNAGRDESGYGMVVGRGTKPISMLDHALQDQLHHGSAHNQLQYGVHIVTEPTVSEIEARFNFVRTFTNLFTDPITVNEIGLYWRTHNVHMHHTTICIARDLIAGGIVVPVDSTLTVRYVPTLTI